MIKNLYSASNPKVVVKSGGNELGGSLFCVGKPTCYSS